MATNVSDAETTREDIPLKSGAKSSSWFSCDEEFFGGPKFISISFAVFTFIITIALFVQIYSGDYQVVPHGSVATDSQDCSAIGTSVLKDGGNAVDAAIASAFCLAVVNPHVTGLDAGGQLLIYSHAARKKPQVFNFEKVEVASSIPRLVLGLLFVHQQVGKLPWKRIIEPSADLAKKGFLVPKTLIAAIENLEAQTIFGSLEAGQTLKLPKLGNTIQEISELIAEEVFNTLVSYNQTVKSEALLGTFKYYNVYVPKLPSAGPLLLYNLKNIELENFKDKDIYNPRYTSTLANITWETYRNYNVSSHFFQSTTSNIGVMDQDDLYVSLVTGMYAPFGTRQMTQSGYLIDVSTINLPPSHIPIIITDKEYVCGRRLVLGASGISTASQLISSLLTGSENATSGIEGPRYKFMPEEKIGLEENHSPVFPEEVVKLLETLGPVVMLEEPYGSSNIVEKTKDSLSSHSDSRGGGIASRFK